MSGHIAYIDESGDLGYKFDKPYRRGGSSRFITIASVIAPKEKKFNIQRVIRGIYREYGRKGKELKWCCMPLEGKIEFCRQAKKLIFANDDISLQSVTIDKKKIPDHIKNEPRLLYNHLFSEMLVDKISHLDNITLLPDPRAVKQKYRGSMQDILMHKMIFEKGSNTKISIQEINSEKSYGIQFADMLSGAIQNAFEDKIYEPIKQVANHINHKQIEFPKPKENLTQVVSDFSSNKSKISKPTV